MKIVSIDKIKKTGVDTIVIVSDRGKIEEIAKSYPEIKQYLGSDYFDGEKSKRFVLPSIIEGKKLKYILFAMDENVSEEEILEEFGKTAKEFSSDKAKNVFVDLSLFSSIHTREKVIAALKGLAHGSYSFNKFLTEKSAIEADLIEVYSAGVIKEEVFDYAEEINRSIRLAKEMVDEPANIMTPKEIANIAQESLKNTELEVKIYDEKEIEKLGMNLFMSVAKGSKEEAKLIVMKYMGNSKSREVTALIGKGIAYDTGGYSLKSTKHMKDMKSDMGGAAAVIGAMNLIAAEKPKINVVGVVATCENRISDEAYLPGDIIVSMNGKTVEIENTDAEGRLTLADAMTYAIRNESATKLVDICTLTGACVAALGEEYAGVVTKEDELWEKLEEASLKSLDPCWRLPINKRIIEKNKSKVADLKNSAGQPGCETAAAFVGEFSENLPWIHIDIAGTAMVENKKEYLRAGATGFGVHLLSELVKVL
ncbi:leucyl aminopeptidase [Peptostreptococcus russellii]|uniref:leucyl aminopeptidase n=1 Tax=Peptostreptococcus russellii TaxID=215200 RepID=UPI0016248265|nr:leucyl aminopeptidase [Peptostreptococcus russellii]MBC2578217.1 leucyl aminopeptidase [Peptostreptococcus russellii]